MNKILKHKEDWSAKELKELEDEWNHDGEYENIKASHIQDCKETENKCPNGCNLTIHEPNNCVKGWHVMHDNMSCHKKTVYCEKHNYARIYVISETNYSRTKE